MFQILLISIFIEPTTTSIAKFQLKLLSNLETELLPPSIGRSRQYDIYVCADVLSIYCHERMDSVTRRRGLGLVTRIYSRSAACVGC
jgi:hypothetical protein